MAATHQALITALRQRLAIIADREAYNRDPAAHLEQLKSISEVIVTLGSDLPHDPRLDHYLKNSSYEKALAHLESAEPSGT